MTVLYDLCVGAISVCLAAGCVAITVTVLVVLAKLFFPGR